MGRRLLREQTSTSDMLLQINRRAIDSWLPGNSCVHLMCTPRTYSTLLKSFNSMGLILVIIMTILYWQNCDKCEVVLYLPCYLYYCNKIMFILAVKHGNVSKRSALKDFQVNCGLQPPTKQKKSILHLQFYKTVLRYFRRTKCSILGVEFQSRTLWGYFPISVISIQK